LVFLAIVATDSHAILVVSFAASAMTINTNRSLVVIPRGASFSASDIARTLIV
jgi:hypothetical protein